MKKIIKKIFGRKKLTKQEINYLIEFLLSLTDNSSLSKEVLTPNTVPSGLNWKEGVCISGDCPK